MAEPLTALSANGCRQWTPAACASSGADPINTHQMYKINIQHVRKPLRLWSTMVKSVSRSTCPAVGHLLYRYHSPFRLSACNPSTKTTQKELIYLVSTASTYLASTCRHGWSLSIMLRHFVHSFSAFKPLFHSSGLYSSNSHWGSGISNSA